MKCWDVLKCFCSYMLWVLTNTKTEKKNVYLYSGEHYLLKHLLLYFEKLSAFSGVFFLYSGRNFLEQTIFAIEVPNRFPSTHIMIQTKSPCLKTLGKIQVEGNYLLLKESRGSWWLIFQIMNTNGVFPREQQVNPAHLKSSKIEFLCEKMCNVLKCVQ